MTTKTLSKLHDEAEDLGYTPDTPEFEKALCALKVSRCKELQGVHECKDCKAYEHCDLVREYLLDLRFPTRRNR